MKVKINHRKRKVLIISLVLISITSLFVVYMLTAFGYKEVKVVNKGYEYTFLFDSKAELFDEGAIVAARGKDINNKTVLGILFQLPPEGEQHVCGSELQPVAFQVETKYGKYPVCIMKNESIAALNFNVDGTWHILNLIIPSYTSKLEKYEKTLDRETVKIIVESISVAKL